MKESIWLAVSPGAHATRVLGMRAPRETILRAHLSLRPRDPRALEALLETLSVWEGARISAALVADGTSTSSSTTLFRDNFAVFGKESARWKLAWVAGDGPGRRDVGKDGFGDLARLLTRAAGLRR
jgi:hypothetical protein